jgi:hypothetical protein
MKGLQYGGRIASADDHGMQTHVAHGVLGSMGIRQGHYLPFSLRRSLGAWGSEKFFSFFVVLIQLVNFSVLEIELLF